MTRVGGSDCSLARVTWQTKKEICSKAGQMVDCLEVANAKEYFDEIYVG